MRGVLFHILKKKKILLDSKITEARLSKDIEKLDFNNSLLSDNLDLDYIETLIRERFLLGNKKEKVYIIKDYEN